METYLLNIIDIKEVNEKNEELPRWFEKDFKL